MPICDASDNVLFPDETTRKTCFNSGPISLSNSWCQGNLGINTADGSWRVITVLRTQHEVRYAFQKMEQTTKHAPMDNSFPHSSAHVSLGLRKTDHWQCIQAIRSILQSVVDLLMEQRCCFTRWKQVTTGQDMLQKSNAEDNTTEKSEEKKSNTTRQHVFCH